MNLIDAAKARHEEVQRKEREKREQQLEAAFLNAQRAAAQWAAQVLTTGTDLAEYQSEQLRIPDNWDLVEESWPEGADRPQIKVRCFDAGLDFQYFCESKTNAAHHHFQVLCRIEHPNPGHAQHLREAGNQFFTDWEYVDVRDLAHLGELAAAGRVAYMLRGGGYITTDELEKREAWVANPNVTWESCHTDEPGDQQAGLYGSYDAQVGPSHPDGWSWTLLDRGFDGDQEISDGTAATEEEAKAAVVQHLIDYLEGTA